MRMSARTMQYIRWILATAVILMAVIVIATAWFDRPSQTSVQARTFNEGIKTAIDLQLESAATLNQITVIFLAALWGLIIAKPSEAQLALSDPPEMILFVASSLLLLMSFALYQFYVAEITEAFRVAGVTALQQQGAVIDIPDVFQAYYAHLFWFQRRFLIAGAACGVLTLVSAHKLRS